MRDTEHGAIVHVPRRAASPVACYHRRMRAGVGVLTTAMVLLGASPAAAAGEATIDLLSYNVWAVPYGISPNIDARLQAIATEIVRRGPDLVALQELWRPEDAEAVGARLTEAGYQHHHFGPGAGGPDDDKGSGLFIASRWPISEVSFEAFTAGHTPHIPWHVDWMANKGVAAVRVQSPVGPVVVADTHLQATYLTGNYNFVQMAQALSLSRRLHELGREAPLFLVGDLNAAPRSLPVDLITAQLGLVPAQPNYDLDHILSRPGRHLGVELEDAAALFEESVRYEGGEGPLSDHPCLVARYRLYPCDGCQAPAPLPPASLSQRIAAQLERERGESDLWLVAGRGLALLVLVTAVYLYRRLGRARRIPAAASSLLLFFVALYLAYVGFYFAPARRAEVDRAAAAVEASSP